MAETRLRYPLVGAVEQYIDHEIEVRRYGPDYLAYVNHEQVGQFWVTPQAAARAARASVDETLAESKKKFDEARRKR